jgi:AcrR family transcriptional regulator
VQARRQAILDAGLHLFVERGLGGASVEDIRLRSGASVGSIYHHFGSKEGIAAALYASAIADYQRGALAVVRRAASAEEGVKGLVRQFLTWVGRHRDLATLMLAVEHTDVRTLAADDVAALNQAFLADVGPWVQAHVATGALPRVPPDVWLPALLGPARRFAEMWVEGRTRTSITEAARLLANLAWAGLGGTASTRGR